jgi:hypothetical protein
MYNRDYRDEKTTGQGDTERMEAKMGTKVSHPRQGRMIAYRSPLKCSVRVRWTSPLI